MRRRGPDPSEPQLRFAAAEDDVDRRLDRVARRLFPALPLSRIYSAIRTGELRIEGRTSSASERVRRGDVLVAGRSLAAGRGADMGFVPPRAADSRPVPPRAGAARPDAERPGGPERRRRPPPRLEILFEGPHLLALNKPSGLLVHGPGSLAEAASTYLADRIAPSLSFTPGPLHRLDRSTSGVVLFGKSLEGARAVTRCLAEGRAIKLYLALVEGAFDAGEPIVWDEPLERDRIARVTRRGGGRAAQTIVQPLRVRRFAGRTVTLCVVRISSGRTHQIRAHAALHGHSLVGDRKYGGAGAAGDFLLHAWCFALVGDQQVLPVEGVVAPLPRAAIERLGRLFGREAVAKLHPPFPFGDNHGIIAQ